MKPHHCLEAKANWMFFSIILSLSWFAFLTGKAEPIPNTPRSAEYRRNLQEADLTDDLKKTCDQAIKKMEIAKTVEGEKPVQSMAEAQRLIWYNISLATTFSLHSRVEYKGWFMFSRLDWAKTDDGSFKSGIAVKKGTTNIYKWEL